MFFCIEAIANITDVFIIPPLPLLFFEGHPRIFIDHRKSGPRFNVSSFFFCSQTVFYSISLFTKEM